MRAVHDVAVVKAHILRRALEKVGLPRGGQPFGEVTRLATRSLVLVRLIFAGIEPVLHVVFGIVTMLDPPRALVDRRVANRPCHLHAR